MLHRPRPLPRPLTHHPNYPDPLKKLDDYGRLRVMLEIMRAYNITTSTMTPVFCVVRGYQIAIPVSHDENPWYDERAYT